MYPSMFVFLPSAEISRSVNQVGDVGERLASRFHLFFSATRQVEPLLRREEKEHDCFLGVETKVLSHFMDPSIYVHGAETENMECLIVEGAGKGRQ